MKGKSDKKNAHPGSRSLADQLRDAFPPSAEPNSKSKAKAAPKAVAKVRILPAAPVRKPELAKKAQGQHRSQTPLPPAWQPAAEEMYIEVAFPESAIGAAIQRVGGVPNARQSLGDGSGIHRTHRVATVQVGLDFGTSFTKALWVRTGVPERRVRAVNFEHGLAGVPSFCIPSVGAFDSRGNLLMGDIALTHLKSGPASRALSRFKMLLAGAHDPAYIDEHAARRFRNHVLMALKDSAACTPEMLTVVYLAYVMRRVRRKLEKDFAGTDVDASFATCVPVDQVQNSAVMAAFGRVASAAERVERQALDNEPLRGWLDRARSALSEPVLSSSEAKLHLVPEAVAATAGYVRSHERASGIHALVDIGNGTTDISIVNIHDVLGRDPETSWYAARSIPRGTAYVEMHLADEIEKTGRAAKQSEILDLMNGIGGKLATARDVIREELTAIWDRTRAVWSEAHLHLRTEQQWKGSAVRIFLAGGGAMITGATTVFQESWMQSPNWGPYPCALVPDPEGYDDRVVGGPFVRICVAYGLTTPLPELGKWVLPNDVRDHTPLSLPRREIAYDGDQLVPRPGWV